MARVRADSLIRGSNQPQFNLFFGKLDQLIFGRSHQLAVARGYSFFLLARPRRGGNGLVSKWPFKSRSHISGKMKSPPPSTSPRWNIIWHKAKAQKEVAFLYLVIHNVVAVNERHGKISAELYKSCPLCRP